MDPMAFSVDGFVGLAGFTGLPSTLAASSEPSVRRVPTAVTRLPTAMSASDAVLSPRVA